MRTSRANVAIVPAERRTIPGSGLLQLRNVERVEGRAELRPVSVYPVLRGGSRDDSESMRSGANLPTGRDRTKIRGHSDDAEPMRSRDGLLSRILYNLRISTD